LKKKDKQKKGESWKKRKVILKKKRKKGKFGKKNKKVIKKKRNALWITIIIHNALGVGEQ
jgi:hypothetical protein